MVCTQIIDLFIPTSGPNVSSYGSSKPPAAVHQIETTENFLMICKQY